jgi:hypothetical protein
MIVARDHRTMPKRASDVLPPAYLATLPAPVVRGFDYLVASPTARDLLRQLYAHAPETEFHLIQGLDNNSFNDYRPQDARDAGIDLAAFTKAEIAYGDAQGPREPSRVNWNPHIGLVVEAGMLSPATALIHECFHVVDFATNRAQFMREHVSANDFVTQMLNILKNGDVAEDAVETRAAAFEAKVEAELGEPIRRNYADAAGFVKKVLTVSTFRHGGFVPNDGAE